MTTQTQTGRKAIYEAIAQYSNRDAGFVCYGRTREECETKARKQTTMTIKVRRTLVDTDQLAKLEALGKL